MRKIPLLLLLLLLAACRSPEQQALQQYHTLLADAFGQSSELVLPAPFPPRRALALGQLDRQLTLLEALQLKQCDLLYLASDKNQILSKHQSAADNFVFQQTLLTRLNTCLAQQLELTADDRQFITQLRDEKQQKLPAYFWHLLFQDAATYPFFASGTQLYPLEGHRFAYDSLQALRYLNQIKPWPAANTPLSRHTLNTDALNRQLQILAQSHYLSSLLYSAQLATVQLNQATQLLAQNRDTISCRSRRHPAGFSQLKAIFVHRYVKQMQPYIAQINDQLHQVMPLFRALITPYPHGLAADTAQQLNFILQTQARLIAASQTHQGQWQALFTLCNQDVSVN